MIFKKKELKEAQEEAVNPIPAKPVTPLGLKLGYTQDNNGNFAGFYLPEEDRSTDCYVLGSSGVGKQFSIVIL